MEHGNKYFIDKLDILTTFIKNTMDKIKKIWVETYTKKNGEQYFTAHAKTKWLFFLTTENVYKHKDGSFGLLDEYYSMAYHFDSKEDAIAALESIVQRRKRDKQEEEENRIIKIKKEYISL